MPESIAAAADERAAALLRVAAYLSRHQKFMAVGEARAEMRRTLELAEEGGVALTTHGEPEAAVVPFTTLEDIRRALMQLLISEMEASSRCSWRGETTPKGGRLSDSSSGC